ncbi:MAG: ATP synthase F0 subunit B [Deltaproteobacteria bacterium]|nr:ATP synthase F0 subunit B [Deltaproteobacteria bacterium]
MTHSGESLLSIVFKFVNFTILLAILIKFASKPIKNYLFERHQRIKDEIENRKKALDEIDSKKRELELKLQRLDAEVEEIRKKVLEEAYAEKERIISEARTLAQKMKDQAMLTKEQEIREIREMIKQEIAKRSIFEAERIIRETLRKEDHDRLVRDFIERLRSFN